MLTHQVVCPVIVGRQGELDALASQLDSAAAGEGQTIFVTGDAGIGKSRIVRELRHHAIERGVRVLEGRSASTESSTPYGPFMDALRFRLARGEGEAASRMLGPIASHLAPLIPELGGDPGGEIDAESLPTPSDRLFETIHQVFERLAALGPLLLVLEDFQYADSTSRELLRFVARRVRRMPILILVTCRSDELNPRHPVRRLIASLVGERVAREIPLRPLDEHGVGQMVAAILRTDPAPDLATVVYRRTEGNPFFVEELLQALADTGRLVPGADDVERVHPPSTVHEMVLQRLEPLGEKAFGVLSVAAVIGRRFEFDTLSHVTGLSEEELLPIVENLVEQQVLIEEHAFGGDSYAFRHVLMQEVLYNHLLARRRRLLHRGVAAALEGQPPNRIARSAAALAFHHGAGGNYVAARKYAVLAGDAASRLFAWQEAESWYERALESLEGSEPDATLEADVLEKLAYVSWWQGRADAALEYMEEALAIRRQLGVPSTLAATLRHAALLHAYHRGDWGRGVALLREALTLVDGEALGDGREAEGAAREALGDIDAARIANDLGRLLIGAGDATGAEQWLQRALDTARRAARPVEEAFARAHLGLVCVLRGRVSAGLEHLYAARQTASNGPIPLDRATGIYTAGIQALHAAHENASCLEWIAASSQYCERHGVPANQAINDAYRASIALRTGERSEAALEVATAAADTLRASKRAELRDALRVVANIHRARGDYPAARDCYAEAAKLGDLASEAGIALVLLASDRAASAADRLDTLVASIDPELVLPVIELLAPAIEAAVAAQRFAEAFEMLDALRHAVERSDARIGPPLLERAASHVAAASGDVTAAISHLEAAAAGWATLGEPLEQALALADLARLLLTSERDAERAAALGREAIRMLQSAGAAAEVERVRRMLRRAGVRVRTVQLADAPPAAEATASPYGLTAREQEVLTELVAGRTNKEIAAALGISEKTASIHVSHILAKLGCATRTQAAGVALGMVEARG